MSKNPFKNNPIINKNQQLLNQINGLENNLKILSDDELRIKNINLQKKYNTSQKLNLLIAESFAITREASIRTLGLRHFDVQLLGGLTLNNGKIAEMKTGEGKTLVATLPTVLNAAKKLGVHVVTVNEYLANRDQVSMGQIYRFLGLKTGLIKVGMTNSERKKNYNADITYVTNYELVFDFLRDNMVTSSNESVIPNLNYCIIDEVDSILIDEAQTPLIIAGPSEIKMDDSKYVVTEEIIRYLKPNIHFDIDQKNKNIILNSNGNQEIEHILTVQNLYDPQDPWVPYILNALRAQYLYFNNKQYLVQNNRIIIVDEFTGRVMPDRRWSEGLHQAIEVKEKLPIRASTETMASITYQNFFFVISKAIWYDGNRKNIRIRI
jgi:preprotein translocase subunit SecA